MRITLIVLLGMRIRSWIFIPATALMLWYGVARSGPFEDCILQNMKGAQNPSAAAAIRAACEAKTTPVKCRQLPTVDVFDRAIRDACIQECAAASWQVRTFGECRTD
jgi:hypothetical protein